MSMINISEYLFFLKTCYRGHQLLEKCYKVQKVYLELLLEDNKQPRKMAAPLKALKTYTDQALSSMEPSYLGCLILEIVEQQALDQGALIPIWDYALLLNDQYNRSIFLSEQALDCKKPLKKIVSFYQVNPKASAVFFVEHLQKMQEDIHFIHQTMLRAFKDTQTLLEQTPLKSDSNRGTFKALMDSLKGPGFLRFLLKGEGN